MQSRATQGILVLLTFALAACGGADSDDSSLTSRIARAASRSFVDAVLEIDANDTDEEKGHAPEPLTLASSRPDTIIGGSTTESLTTYHIDAISEAARGVITIDADSESFASMGHVVTATVLSDYAKKCSDGARKIEIVETADVTSCTKKVDCPLTRRRDGNLSRI